MPIGISFFTFQTLSYVIDVYKKDVEASKNFINFTTYVSLFPQLVAGPIVRYQTIEKELKDRKVNYNDFGNGVKRFIIGLAKKILIANVVGELCSALIGMESVTVVSSWINAIGFTLQIYFDFSGYSDMAIGLAKMFGFDLLENFNYPYISKSITEFWRRWHISLSTWFREYLYIPLGGNRKGRFRTYINLFIVFLATGIWHGANFTFLVWGIYNGVLIVLERCKIINIKNRVFSHIYTIFAVIIGFVIFRADNLKYAISFIVRMFTPKAFLSGGTDALKFMTPYFIFILICSIIACIPVLSKIKQLKEKNEKTYKFFDNISYIVVFLLFIICFGVLASNSYSPFIYFRF
jgi:alginate O-acetyltransferase complex protein AlgI